jgi:hypothetical protein
MQLGIMDKDTGEEIVKIGQMAGQSFDICCMHHLMYMITMQERLGEIRWI